MIKPSRSKFADRLDEFPDVVLRDEQAFSRRGKWRDYFQQRIGRAFSGRVVFEIGCFDASFLCRIAAVNSEVAFIGLDWKARAIYDGATTIAGKGLRNIVLLRGRAQEMARICGPDEVNEIWLFHPDPCDKPAERANRLFAGPFLADAHRALSPGGSLVLKTDHPGYYQWALALLGQPQPDWFAAAREAHLRGDRPPAELPRVRVKDVVANELLPPPSDTVLNQFEITARSDDFWNDASAKQLLHGRLFADLSTVFEKRFIAKRQPIYLIELTKRR